MTYKYKFNDDGETRYLSSEELIQFAENLREANKTEDFFIYQKNIEVDIDVAIMFVTWGFEWVKELTKEEYYIDLAKETLGNQVRDNNKESLIELGRQIDSGELEY